MIKIKKELLEFVRPSPHSVFSPSSAERWLTCAYSVNASKGIPEETSKFAAEGTLAHSVAEAKFREKFFDVPFPSSLSLEMVAGTSDMGFEMNDCAEAYADVIIFWLNNKEVIGDVVWFGLEKGIPVFPEEGCFGTADCLIIGSKACAVIDFKYGKGKNVAPNSLQLKVYATGVYMNLLDIPKDYRFFSIVHQPRTDMAAKEHSYNVEDLYAFEGEILTAIHNSKKANLEPIEGNHCFWCPAKRTKDREKMCSAIADKPLKLAQENFGKFLADMAAPIEKIGALNPKRDEAIIKLRTLYPLIKQIVENSDEEFKMRLESGEAIPGVRLIEEYGNRTLNADKDADKIALIKQVAPKGFDPVKVIPATAKVKTITEIEKEIGKGKLDTVCVRKVTKKVDVLNEKMRDILGEMASYGQMINNGNSQGE